jgi:hypothetical protein
MGYNDYGPKSGTAVGTTGATTLTLGAAVAGKGHTCSALQASGDSAGLLTVESPAGTVIWRKRFSAAFATSEVFDPPLVGASGQVLNVKLSASTSNAELNAQGSTSNR